MLIIHTHLIHSIPLPRYTSITQTLLVMQYIQHCEGSGLVEALFAPCVLLVYVYMGWLPLGFIKSKAFKIVSVVYLPTPSSFALISCVGDPH